MFKNIEIRLVEQQNIFVQFVAAVLIKYLPYFLSVRQNFPPQNRLDYKQRQLQEKHLEICHGKITAIA